MPRVAGAVALVVLVVFAGCLAPLGALPGGNGKPLGCPASVSNYNRPGFHRAFPTSYESGPSMNAFVVVHENGTLVGASGSIIAHNVASDGSPRINLTGHPTGLHTYTIDAYVDSNPNGHYDAKDTACGMAGNVTVLLPTWGGLANATATVTPASSNASSTRRYTATLTRPMTVHEVALGGYVPAITDARNVTAQAILANGTVVNATTVTTREASPRLVVGHFAQPVRLEPSARVVLTNHGPNPQHGHPGRVSLVVNPYGRAYTANTTAQIPGRPSSKTSIGNHHPTSSEPPSVAFNGTSFPSGVVRVRGRFPDYREGFVVVTENGTVVGHTALFGANLTTYHDIPIHVNVTDGTHQLHVTVYQDSNGNKRLNKGDEAYRIHGKPVGETATITLGNESG